MDILHSMDSVDLKQAILEIAATFLVFGLSFKFLRNFYYSRKYGKIILAKQNALGNKKVMLYKKLLSLETPFQNMDSITSMNLKELKSSIDNGKFTSIEVLRAFQAKALTCNEDLNFIIDINEESELICQQSSALEDSPIKGIPISIKDSAFVKGCDSTFGMAQYVNEAGENNSIIVELVRRKGAIPFIVTNMCQTGLSMESSNPIIGETRNPHNKNRTCGGSSGGEGAILGCGASILGIGTDIGGSIRIPAHYCGVYGLKPTCGRLSLRKCRKLGPKQQLIKVSIGPMARELNDLVELYKCLVSETLHKLDSNCPNIPFNDAIYESRKPLRIGYYVHLGGSQVQPIPAVERAVLEAMLALGKSGHELVEFHLPKIDYAIFDLYLKSLFADGGCCFVNTLGDAPIDSTLKLTYYMAKMPNIFKRIISKIVEPFNKGYSRGLNTLTGCESIYNLFLFQDLLDEYREMILKYLQELQLDAWICPTYPIVAPLLKTSDKMLDVVGYTAIYNLLDYPASVIPITKVTEQDVNKLKADYPTDTPTHREIKKNQVDTIGMPIGVQCVSFKWQEETCLRVMKDIKNNS